MSTSLGEYEVNWDELSVGSNESFFDRSHSEHEPLQKSGEIEERLSASQPTASRENKENQPTRKGRATEKEPPKAQIRPRSLTRPRATIPVTPNVLKKRIVPKLPRAQPAPFVFKAKPAPAFHKSTGNLNKVANQINKLQISPTENLKKDTDPKPQCPATVAAPARSSRALTKPANNAQPPRSKSVPKGPPLTRTIPVTPMVLKRQQRRTVNVIQKPEVCFKAKPAGVLQRQPFKPKLNHNNNQGTAAATAVATKPFEFRLEDRLKDRKVFNHRSTEALEKKNKQLEEEKARKLEEQHAAARRLTNFRANKNPFK